MSWKQLKSRKKHGLDNTISDQTEETSGENGQEEITSTTILTQLETSGFIAQAKRQQKLKTYGN